MAVAGRRIALVGATGTVGAEVLELLQARGAPVAELRAYAGATSAGDAVDFQGEAVPIRAGEPDLTGLDLAILCAPSGVALDAARAALRAGVPCIDVSDALADRAEVPLLAAALEPDPDRLRQPVIAALGGPALVWALALAPIFREAGLRRVVGTHLEAASAGGREGLLALSGETVALFNQADPPGPEAFPHPVAFDCVPVSGEPEAGGRTTGEGSLERRLARVLPGLPRLGVTRVRVPTFCGDGASLYLETERPLDADTAVALLRGAPGLALWDEVGPALSTRASTGLNQVLVGRVRQDPAGAGLLLWLAADVPRATAANAVQLAEARWAAG